MPSHLNARPRIALSGPAPSGNLNGHRKVSLMANRTSKFERIVRVVLRASAARRRAHENWRPRSTQMVFKADEDGFTVFVGFSDKYMTESWSIDAWDLMSESEKPDGVSYDPGTERYSRIVRVKPAKTRVLPSKSFR